MPPCIIDQYTPGPKKRVIFDILFKKNLDSMVTLEQLGVSDPISTDQCYLEALRHLRQLRSLDPDTNTRKEGPRSPGPARASTRGSGNGTITTNDDFYQEDHQYFHPPARLIHHSSVSCQRCRQQRTTATADRTIGPRRTNTRNTPFLNTYMAFLADHRNALIHIISLTHEPAEPSVVVSFPQS